MPKYLELARAEMEWSLINHGESQYLIGVPSDFQGNVLEMSCSIRGLRVVNKSLPALNMTPTQVTESLERDARGKLIWKR